MHKGGSVLNYETANAVSDPRYIEVYQQAEALICQSQISEYLCLEQSKMLFCGFYLDDKLAGKQKINSEGVVDVQILIDNRQYDLSSNGNPSFLELVG